MPYGLIRRAAFALCSGGILLCAAVPADAQRMIRAFRGEGAADPQQGVYVRDSAIAADKFELGKRMERLKEWHKSADVYQEILEKYQDRVVPVAFNDKNQPIRYASVTVAVQINLAKWPEEGLNVYRARFEPIAASMLEQARYDDYAALHTIFSRYFVTNSARDAGIRLIELYLESGEFSAAAWLGDRLLDWHPSLAERRASILFRTAVAYHLSGSEGQSKRRFDELKQKFPQERGLIAGQETALVDALAQQLQQKPPAALGSAGDSYLTFGGDASRSLVPAASGIAGARIYSIELPGPNVEGLNEANAKATLEAHANARNLGSTMGVIPAFDRGQLFFQDGWRIYAVHIESGVPLAGWAQTYSGARMGQFWLPRVPGGNPAFFPPDQLNASQFMSARQHTLTLTDDAVLGVMGFPGLRAPIGPQAGNDGGTRLVCLDRNTGRVRWIATPRVAANDQARSINFSGSPIVVGDNVYVIARGSTGAGVEDCHVCCYNVSTGDFRWSCYVASSQSGPGNFPGMVLAPDDDSLSHLAFASGRLFVVTNLGAVAAIDAYSGATSWLSVYPRDERATNLAAGRMQQMGWGWNGAVTTPGPEARPWEFNPVIVRDGHVFVLPADGKHALVYDAGTGEELRRISRELDYGSGFSMRMTMLLAAMDEKLLMAGGKHVLCLDWTSYNKADPDSRKGDMNATFWYQPYADDIKGRPFLTQSALFVPLENRLSIFMTVTKDQVQPRLNLASCKVVRTYPREGSWPADQGPGNVLVTQDHVVIASARSVDVYTDLEGIRQKYLAAIQTNPTNVEARLVFSELMFNARESAEALRAFDEAIGVLGGMNAMRPGALRDRIFSDALMFAQRTGRDRPEGFADLADKLFDRAAAAAQDPSQQVSYRLARAQYIESLREVQRDADLSRAVRLYQEILMNPAMREVMLSGPDGAALAAARKADAAIEDLITRAGRGVYSAFEQQAADALLALSKTRDADKLLSLAETYPHSLAAAQALMQAANLYESADQPRMATLVLRRLYWKYQQLYTGDKRAELAEAMARNYLKLGNVGAALGRVQRIANVMPGAKLSAPLIAPGGKPLQTAAGRNAQTLQEAAAALQQLLQQQAAESLPDIKLPPPMTAQERVTRKRTDFYPPTPESIIANVQAVITPPVDLPEYARYDRIILWTAGQLACLPPGAPRPLWTSPALGDVPSNLLWIEGRVLLWNADEAAMLDGNNGRLVWKLDLKALPAIDTIISGPGESSGDVVAQNGGDPAVLRQLEVQRRFDLAQRAFVRGGIVAIAPMPPALAPMQARPNLGDGRERILHARPLSDRIILSTSTGRVVAVSASEGTLLWQARVARGSIVQQTLATDDFTVVRISDESQAQIVVLDSFNGQQISRRRFDLARGRPPINCALSPDGNLVWTTQQSLVVKDLYEPGDSPTFEQPNLSFAGMTEPDHIVIWGQQVFAVCNNGQFVVRRSLRKGDSDPMMLGSGRGDAVTTPDGSTRLRLSGARLYVISSTTLMSYHLEYETSMRGLRNEDVISIPQQTLLTRNYLVLPGQVTRDDSGLAPAQPVKDTRYSLQAYSRALAPTSDTGKMTESGLQVHRFDFDEPSRVRSFHAVEGGVYFLAGDDKLHFLRGTAP